MQNKNGIKTMNKRLKKKKERIRHERFLRDLEKRDAIIKSAINIISLNKTLSQSIFEKGAFISVNSNKESK